MSEQREIKYGASLIGGKTIKAIEHHAVFEYYLVDKWKSLKVSNTGK